MSFHAAYLDGMTYWNVFFAEHFSKVIEDTSLFLVHVVSAHLYCDYYHFSCTTTLKIFPCLTWVELFGITIRDALFG